MSKSASFTNYIIALVTIYIIEFVLQGALWLQMVWERAGLGLGELGERRINSNDSSSTWPSKHIVP